MVAGGSVDRFLAELPAAGDSRLPRQRLAAVLDAITPIMARAHDAEVRWRETAFASSRGDGAGLAERTRETRAAAQALMMAQSRFLFLRRKGVLPAVRYDIASPQDVEARYAAALSDPARIYMAPAKVPWVEVSGRMAGANATEYWICFASPSDVMADTVYALVQEPMGVTDPPTLIFGHGLYADAEQMAILLNIADPLIAAGIRVVQLDAPWHGRRTLPGEYGGERFMASAPMGVIDLLSAQVREMAVIVDWCRQTSKGPVAVGGVSLGALTAQLVGTHARHWPRAMRPDALLLVTTCDRLERVLLDSSLAAALALPQALAARGWTAELLDRWAPLIDPEGKPAVAPENIVAVLGSRDTVTPYALGKAMFERWNISSENLLIRRQGHFSASLGLYHDARQFERLAAILGRR